MTRSLSRPAVLLLCASVVAQYVAVWTRPNFYFFKIAKSPQILSLDFFGAVMLAAYSRAERRLTRPTPYGDTATRSVPGSLLISIEWFCAVVIALAVGASTRPSVVGAGYWSLSLIILLRSDCVQMGPRIARAREQWSILLAYSAIIAVVSSAYEANFYFLPRVVPLGPSVMGGDEMSVVSLIIFVLVDTVLWTVSSDAYKTAAKNYFEKGGGGEKAACLGAAVWAARAQRTFSARHAAANRVYTTFQSVNRKINQGDFKFVDSEVWTTDPNPEFESQKIKHRLRFLGKRAKGRDSLAAVAQQKTTPRLEPAQRETQDAAETAAPLLAALPGTAGGSPGGGSASSDRLMVLVLLGKPHATRPCEMRFPGRILTVSPVRCLASPPGPDKPSDGGGPKNYYFIGDGADVLCVQGGFSAVLCVTFEHDPTTQPLVWPFWKDKIPRELGLMIGSGSTRDKDIVASAVVSGQTLRAYESGWLPIQLRFDGVADAELDGSVDSANIDHVDITKTIRSWVDEKAGSIRPPADFAQRLEGDGRIINNNSVLTIVYYRDGAEHRTSVTLGSPDAEKILSGIRLGIPGRAHPARPGVFSFAWTYVSARVRAWLIDNTNIALCDGNQDGEGLRARRRALAEKDVSVLCMLAVLSRTSDVCFAVILLGVFFDPSFLGAAPIIAVLMIGSLCYPRPRRGFWMAMLWYYAALIIAKFAFQMPVLCVTDARGGVTLAPDPRCAAFAQLAGAAGGWDRARGGVNLFGFHKTDSVLRYCAWDFVVILTILLHRRTMARRGLWLKHELDVLDAEKLKNKEKLQADEEKARAAGPRSASQHTSEVVDERRGADEKRPPGPGSRVPTDDDDDDDDDDDGKMVSEPGSGGASAALAKYAGQYGAFFANLFTREPRRNPGENFYSMSFATELLSAVYIVMGYSAMVGQGRSIGQSLNSNRFSGGMVLCLFAQLFHIILDRVIWLLGKRWAKVVFHLVSVAFWGYLALVAWPQEAGRSLLNNPSLCGFIILKLLSMMLSARQIKHGYSMQGRVAQFHRTAGVYSGMAFKAYRSIPFVFEMRSLLDWACGASSLDVWESFTLDDIYANMYIVQCNIEYKRMRRRGERQPRYRKVTSGSFVFLALVFVLFGPVYLFSSANPVQSFNNVVSVRAAGSVVGPHGSFELFQIPSAASLRPVTDSEYDYVQLNQAMQPDDNRESVQSVRLDSFSDSLFSTSPPSLSLLVKTLNETRMYASVQFQLDIAFSRPGPPGSTVTRSTTRALLSHDARVQLARALATVPDRDGGGSTMVKGVVPLFLRLPATGQPVSIRRGALGAAVVQMAGNAEHGRYWTLCGVEQKDEMSLSTKLKPNPSRKNKYISPGPKPGPRLHTDPSRGSKTGCDGISFFTISNPIFPELAGVGYSVIGLYVTVVLAVGRFVRLSFSGQLGRVEHTELHNVDDLVQYCEAVYIARYTGQYALEEELFRKLVKIFRTPDLLVKLTRRKEVGDRARGDAAISGEQSGLLGPRDTVEHGKSD